jgi:hypothetical protein
MIKKEYVLISILIIVILALSIAILNLNGLNHGNNSLNVASSHNREVIADDSVGSVEVIRNIGNPNAKKIAYVVGVHPLENLTHKTLLNLLPQQNNLKYCYDIYIINVTQDVGQYGDGSSDNSPGRQNGQNLALKYVYPQIANDTYELAVDVHSNIGAYPYKTFVFSPVNKSAGSEYAKDIAGECENISYYVPDSTTSGPYLTIPLNKNGVPAFYFEEYSFASQSEKDMHMMELINAVDNLDF